MGAKHRKNLRWPFKLLRLIHRYTCTCTLYRSVMKDLEKYHLVSLINNFQTVAVNANCESKFPN